jgi:hypothetical protein
MIAMAERGAVRRWTLLVIAGAGSVVLAMLAPSQARAVARACCFPTGTCQVLSRSVCEDQQGGVSQAIGTTCDMVTCPVLCSATAPECDGECPAGTTCVNPGSGQAHGAVTSAFSLCECVPEIPLGGACDAQADACAAGLACVNGVCAVAPAPAPLLSPAGLAMVVASLIGLGGLAFLRRRRRG